MDTWRMVRHPQQCKLCDQPAGMIAVCCCTTDCGDLLCGAAMVCEPGWRL